MRWGDEARERRRRGNSLIRSRNSGFGGMFSFKKSKPVKGSGKEFELTFLDLSNTRLFITYSRNCPYIIVKEWGNSDSPVISFPAKGII